MVVSAESGEIAPATIYIIIAMFICLVLIVATMTIGIALIVKKRRNERKSITKGDYNIDPESNVSGKNKSSHVTNMPINQFHEPFIIIEVDQENRTMKITDRQLVHLGVRQIVSFGKNEEPKLNRLLTDFSELFPIKILNEAMSYVVQYKLYAASFSQNLEQAKELLGLCFCENSIFIKNLSLEQQSFLYLVETTRKTGAAYKVAYKGEESEHLKIMHGRKRYFRIAISGRF